MFRKYSFVHNQILLSCCKALESYILVTLVLLLFYFIFMKKLLLTCRFCQHYISLI